MITGGAGGIGLATARAFADQGMAICILDCNSSKLETAVRECRSSGVEASGVVVDLSQLSGIQRIAGRLLQDWGPIDVLVNNAGVCFYGPTITMSADQRRRLVNVNVSAPVELTCELLPHLLSRPEAHILNVASMYGLVATNRCSLYHLSKFGLVGFSEALRAEYGKHGLGVTALCPGFVQTDLFTSMPQTRRPPSGMSQSTAARSVRKPPNWLCTSAETVGRAAVKSIRRNRRLMLVSPLAHVLYNTRRVAPWLLDAMYHMSRRRATAKAHPGQPLGAQRDVIPIREPFRATLGLGESKRAA